MIIQKVKIIQINQIFILQNKDKNQIDLDLSQKISISRSQDFKLYRNNDQKTNKNRKSRVRNSIIKSCTSSSSLFHNSLGDSERQEEILDKSIIYRNDSILCEKTTLLNLPIKIERKRRFSLETFSNASFLSSLASERIKAMPKDSTSAILNPL